jgi:uncharacterized protein
VTVFRERKAQGRILEALGDTRVVIVNGARQSGKSTLVHRLVSQMDGAVERHLDRATERDAARRDPDSFVQHSGLIAIDEVQRVPDLILSIKAQVDEVNRAGSFLLTGSARLLGMRRLPDALVGRSETIELWPFSQGEIDGTPDGFVDIVFGSDAGADAFDVPGGFSNADELLRATRGGFPDAVEREERRRSRFFEAYLNDLIDRDVAQLAEIQRRDQLRRLLAILAARTASPLVIEAVASDSGLPATTVERYVSLLEEVFLIKRISAWSSSNTNRAVRQRKLMFVDSGIATSLIGMSVDKLRKNPAMAGPIIENFVLSELARSLTWCEERVSLFHYRSRDGEEIDAILEAADGRIVGIEVKSARSVRDEDFRHLRTLQRREPARFHLGVVLYSGTQVHSFGPRLLAIPMSAVWTVGE